MKKKKIETNKNKKKNPEQTESSQRAAVRTEWWMQSYETQEVLHESNLRGFVFQEKTSTSGGDDVN